ADPGVLVLSRFAGAAHQMGEALIVNPYDLHEVAEAIRTALAMPKSERIRRFERLYATIEATDIGWWTQRYLDALSGIEVTPSDIPSPPTAANTVVTLRPVTPTAAKGGRPKPTRRKAGALDDAPKPDKGRASRTPAKATRAPASRRPASPSG
ncbi:MAG: trehalose-6-phosphate synthase, partial [Hyphomicrobiales bacterium]